MLLAEWEPLPVVQQPRPQVRLQHCTLRIVAELQSLDGHINMLDLVTRPPHTCVSTIVQSAYHKVATIPQGAWASIRSAEQCCDPTGERR